MNEREYQKLVEQRHLHLFLEKHFGEADVKASFDDSPDVIIEANGKRIGIEHTQYFMEHRGPPGLALKAQETLQNKIIQKAWDFYKERGGTLLWLIVVFDDKAAFYGKDVDRVARELANCVEQMLREGLQVNVWYRIEAWRAKRLGRPLPNSISQLHLEIVTSPGLELWGASRSGAVSDLQVSQIQTVIDVKNQRVPDYLLKCSEAWLLIVVDGSSPSSHFEVGAAASGHKYTSEFSRVFLLRRFHQELYQLPVK